MTEVIIVQNFQEQAYRISTIMPKYQKGRQRISPTEIQVTKHYGHGYVNITNWTETLNLGQGHQNINEFLM